MGKALVAGLVNVETSVRVEGFPVEYCPVEYNFFGIDSQVSGVGFNVAAALKTLGSQVEMLTYMGNDPFSLMAEEQLKKLGIGTEHVLKELDSIPKSVNLYDKTGRRRISTDLKDIQEKTFPAEGLEKLIDEADAVVPCNVNFARPVLRAARSRNKLVAVDLHVISNINDDYNREFMENANILFLSNEGIKAREESFISQLAKTYGTEIVVAGMGHDGALIYVASENKFTMMPAVKTRKPVNTIGAGDALFSAFIHFFIKGKSPYEALSLAMVFASYKVGENGGSKGFLSEDKLLELVNSL